MYFKPSEQNHSIFGKVYCLYEVIDSLLAIATLILIIIKTIYILDNKSYGTYSLIEMKYNNATGYFIANNNTQNISLQRNFYNITSTTLDDSALKYCYIYASETKAQEQMQALQSSLEFTGLIAIFIFALIVEIICIFKNPLKKITIFLKKRDFSSFLKIVGLLIGNSPRFIVLIYTGEEFSNCFGFKEDDPFNLYYKAYYKDSRINANTQMTWNYKPVLPFNVNWHGLYAFFAVMFLLVMTKIIKFVFSKDQDFFHSFILIKKNCSNFDELHWSMQFAIIIFEFVVICWMIAMFFAGIFYYFFNVVLIWAQIQEKIACLLSDVYCVRDIFLIVFSPIRLLCQRDAGKIDNII